MLYRTRALNKAIKTDMANTERTWQPWIDWWQDTWEGKWKMAYTVITSLAQFLLPFAVVIAIYLSIFLKLRKRPKVKGTDHLCINYRVTIQVGPNLPLTSKHKFRFGLTRLGQAKAQLFF